MTLIKKELLVPYKAINMFNLVNDPEKYPEFLPWCSNAQVLSQSDSEMTARLNLSYSAFTQSFTTRNELLPGRSIIMNLVDGPFKHFKGEWTFTDIGDAGSKVELNLEFKFENSFLGMAFNRVFEGIASEMINHFYKRAQQIYG